MKHCVNMVIIPPQWWVHMSTFSKSQFSESQQLVAGVNWRKKHRRLQIILVYSVAMLWVVEMLGSHRSKCALCISLKQEDILQEICGRNQKQDVFLVWLFLSFLPLSLSVPVCQKKNWHTVFLQTTAGDWKCSNCVLQGLENKLEFDLLDYRLFGGSQYLHSS